MLAIRYVEVLRRSDGGGLSRRYRTMETSVNRLQKEAKGYLDSLRGAGGI